jgi:hypothetical protein
MNAIALNKTYCWGEEVEQNEMPLARSNFSVQGKNSAGLLDNLRLKFFTKSDSSSEEIYIASTDLSKNYFSNTLIVGVDSPQIATLCGSFRVNDYLTNDVNILIKDPIALDRLRITNPEINSYVEKIKISIPKYFPDARLTLSVINDPESEISLEEVVLGIKTNIPHEKAFKLFGEFCDQFSDIPTEKNLFNFDITVVQ